MKNARTCLAIAFAGLSATMSPMAKAQSAFIDQNNYQCYDVVQSAANPNARMTVQDQFGDHQQVASQLVMFCNPVVIDGDRTANSSAHLACYRTDTANHQGKQSQTLNGTNQFGNFAVTLAPFAQLVCVSSTAYIQD